MENFGKFFFYATLVDEAFIFVIVMCKSGGGKAIFYEKLLDSKYKTLIFVINLNKNF